MLKTKMRSYLLATVLMAVFGMQRSLALSFAGLEAYKLELESHIDSKIRQAVKPMIGEDQYSLSVSVELKDSAEITKLLPQDEPPEVKEEVPAETAEEFKFVETQPTEEETLLPLTKLGVWEKKVTKAPIKSKEQAVAVKQKKFVSYRDFVSGIKVSLFVDQKLKKEDSAALENVVRGALAGTDGRLNVQFGKLTVPEKKDPNAPDGQGRNPASEGKDKNVPEEKPKTWLDYLSEFKMPTAILLSTFTLFVLGLVFTSNMNKLSLRKMNLIEKQAEREEAAFKAQQFREEEKSLLAKTKVAELSENDVEKKRIELKEKLGSLVDSKPKDLALMIRRWVLFRGEGAFEALNFCARSFTVPQISQILEVLNEEERRAWNLAVSRTFTPNDERVGLMFLESQLLVNMISAAPNVDEDLKNLISTLTFQEALGIVMKNIELGAILLQFLQSAQVAKIFEALDREAVAKISQMSVQVTPEIVYAKSKELLLLIQQVRQQMGVRSSFVERLQMLLQEVTPEKEGPLFAAMALQLDRKALLDAARSYFPSDLIPQMPPDLLKRTLSSLPLVKRAEIIHAQPNDRQSFLFSLVGGGKAREVVTEEIENILLEPARATLLKKNGDLLWKQFMQSVRLQTQQDVSRGDLDELISPWLEGFIQRGKGNARRSA